MKPLSEQTLYEILEVPDDAPPGEIQRAYERARALFSPGSLASYTLMAPEEAALLGRRIEEARSVLLDPVARAGYDARLASGTPMPRSGRTSDSTPTVTATVPPGFRAIEPAEQLAAEAAAASSAPASSPEPSPAPPPAAASSSSPPPAAAAPPAAPVAAAAAPSASPAQAPSSPPFAAVGERSAVPAEPAPPARPVERSWFVPEGARWTGEMLRRAREARAITVAQLAERTKITRHHIENVEQDRFRMLPAPVYLRGIVMSMARELRLDGQKVARSYLEHMAEKLAQPG
ncbi:MAG TPA: helix-turn-helix domain-containing protein [Anaeromyxobacteraceae bacterium]|nr:helix-turn-helix domain-containing protein [Anaeromyxobacteraceae bacterium]